MLPQLFDPFSQVDKTLDRSQGGLGLGLALVKGLVELHAGTVEARSDGPDKGAEFIVRLPIEDDGANTPPYGGAPSTDPVGHRILVIEDNVDSAESLKMLLKLDGHEVALAHSGQDGLAGARAFDPELVLCDIGLPGMDGYEVARAIRSDPDLAPAALVALSGYARPEDIQQATEAGFDHHVAKPPSIELIKQILAELKRDA
jgi:CheY-like chemotaxis protein